MAQIKIKHAGQSVADFAVSGAIVTVAGVVINCAERQQDEAVTIEIRTHLGMAVEGGDNGSYLAHIHIPARIYTTIFDPLGGMDGQGGNRREPQTLDCSAIAVVLWPIESAQS
ncbi:MAG: hypothetical protein ACRCT2_10375 [Plesiomonas shigelloides]